MPEVFLGAVLSLLVKILGDLLSREVLNTWGPDARNQEVLNMIDARIQEGVPEQVADLKRQMRTLQSLLKDVKKYETERVRNFLEDVKDIVYDSEDIIESFLLKETLPGFFVDRQKFATDIECITKRISELVAQMQSLGIQQIIDGHRSLSLQERQMVQREIRRTFPNSSESNLVGVKESVEELVDHLVKNDNIQVVSISGMGGIGKTTLARQVFKHDTVRHHFDGFAWVCLSQEFTQKDIWQRILQDLRPHDGEIKQMDEHILQGKLFQMLETSRYLIVLDDVWKNEDWDRIKAIFPHKGGWKMLLTSRNEDVGFHANPTCFAFKARIRTPEESWKLCESIVFARRGEAEFRVDEELKAMGKKMVTCCGGLPLAIKVLGGFLAKKHTISEWKKVYENIGTKIVGSGLDGNKLNSVYRVFSMSYEDLPVQLKHCFLCLAHFPKDYKIELKKLYYYWASEGIIMSVSNGATIEESGKDYLEELVRRNMVIVLGANLGLTLENCDYCQMHDMMREVCLSKAKEENFLHIIKVSTSTSTISDDTPTTRSRRLVVHSGNALDMLRHKNNKKARTVLYFGDGENLWKQPDPGLESLPLLRVLDLDKVKFEGGKLPSSIGELIHLRFLSLREAYVSHIPSSLRNLKLLLYLDLCFDREVEVHVPNMLKEMLELRFLMLPYHMDDETKLEFGDLVNMEQLMLFSTKHCSLTDLLRMTRLKHLMVNFNGGCTSETLWSSLRGLRNLHSFTLVDIEESQKHLDFYGGDFAMDFIHLMELILVMHLPRFPDQFTPHLAQISLMHCRMEEDPMPVLEKLLHLKSVQLLDNAFVGKKMVCSKGGFSQLITLEISNLEELEEWIVEEGSMPCLGALKIIECKNLKELPDGLKYITSLKELKIEEMKREWTKKLVPNGQDYFKVQHILDVQFISCDDQ